MLKRTKVIFFFLKCLIYSFIIIFIDFLICFFFIGLNQLFYTLSLVVLLEGGVCLVGGGAAVLYSPSIAKINEVLFHSKPWTATQQKQIEKQIYVLIGIGAFLIVEALLLSIY